MMFHVELFLNFDVTEVPIDRRAKSFQRDRSKWSHYLK